MLKANLVKALAAGDQAAGERDQAAAVGAEACARADDLAAALAAAKIVAAAAERVHAEEVKIFESSG